MAYTLGDAARATGKTKPTISRAIRRGAISATKKPDGSYAIEPAELHRVYPPVTERHAPSPGTSAVAETALLQAAQDRIAELQETVADLRAERDRLLRMIESERQQRLLSAPSWWRRLWGAE